MKKLGIMKKISLILIGVLLSLISIAHTISNNCWGNNQYSFNCTQLPNGIGTITIVDGNGNPTGEYSGVVNVTNNSIVIYIPQPIRTTTKRVKFVWSDGYINFKISGTNQCSLVAIKEELRYSINNTFLTLKWNYDSSSYKEITIQESNDGINFKNVHSLKNKENEYYINYYSKFYRLKITKNNIIEYSNTINTTNDKEYLKIINNSLVYNSKINKQSEILIFNINNKLIYKQIIIINKGINKFLFQLPKSSGIYFGTINNNSFKFIIF